jgi:hypothetical protein
VVEVGGATSWKIVILIPDEVSESFQPHYGLGAYSASDRNQYQKMFMKRKAWLTRKADKLHHHL